MIAAKSSPSQKASSFNIRFKFKQFCKHSTLHGLYYFYCSSRWTVHLLWISIIVPSLLLCAFLSQMIWNKFIIDPTFTVVESTRYSISEVPFPAVSVCDTGLVYGPNTENITAVLKRRGYSDDQVHSFYHSITDVQRKGFVPEAYQLKMHALLDDVGYSYSVLIDTIKKPCDILLTECTWRSKRFSCTDLFREVYTFLGYCCQFDVPYFRNNVKGVSFHSGVESTEGLIVRINGGSISTEEEFSGGKILELFDDDHIIINALQPADVWSAIERWFEPLFDQLYIFNYGDSITLLDSAITLTSSTYYDVNVDVSIIDSSENVKSLSINDRKCLLSSDQGSDFYQGCLTSAILQKVVETCRCLPFNYTAAEIQVVNYSRCSWDRLFCVYGTIEKTLAEMKGIIADSNCYQRCDNVQYETKTKYVGLKKKNTKMDNHSIFLVHFADNTCMKYRREVLYSWDQMLANLGGIFGLCVGGSLISIVELLWFLIDLLFTILFSTKGTPEQNGHKDFARKKTPKKLKNNYVHNKKYFLN